jgi:predicted nucleic acid-binding protein
MPGAQSTDHNVLIATFCTQNDFEFIHNDRDFDLMKELLGLREQQA